MRTDYTDLIKAVASRYRNLDPDFLEAQVLVESNGHADAFRFEEGYWERYLRDNPTYAILIPRRAASSYGLLQIMYPTARDLGFTGPPELLFVPEVGLDFGAHYLSTLIKWAEGDYVRALCAYNGGKGAALTHPYRTQAYADKVLRRKLDLS